MYGKCAPSCVYIHHMRVTPLTFCDLDHWDHKHRGGPPSSLQHVPSVVGNVWVATASGNADARSLLEPSEQAVDIEFVEGHSSAPCRHLREAAGDSPAIVARDRSSVVAVVAPAEFHSD